MNRNRTAKILPKEGASRHAFGEELRLPPSLFQHQDLIDPIDTSCPVKQNSLKNTLNHIHFMDSHIFVHLRHPKYEASLLLKAFPGPCTGKELTCRWSDENPIDFDLENYQFLHLIIDDGRSVLLVPAILQEINSNCLIVQLPTTSYYVGQRQAKRYACRQVGVELNQSGFQARGELLDFSPVGFRVRVRPVSPCSFHWLNSEESAFISLRDDQQILFSGLCQFIREQACVLDKEKEMVLVPKDKKISRFKRDRVRNPRRHLVPSPDLIFDHPLLRTRIQLEVSDISTSGFCAYEKADEGILIQGLIVPELVIQFADGLKIKCSAQVIYRSEEEEKGIRCGITILDMDLAAYTRLNGILTNFLDPHAYICDEVDVEALWKFFFESGFLYPDKYRAIQSYREDFKKTYQKFYKGNTEIGKHFTYQKNGRIYSHISMVKAYEKAWLIQHHAAKPMDGKHTPGLLVLKQTMHYLHDMYRLPSARIDYVMCYFQPDNKFPDRVFGGFTRELKDPRVCSMDLFCYLPYTTLSLGAQLSKGWSLNQSSALDLEELNWFYSRYSGGLLLEALGLAGEDVGNGSLEQVYARAGFLRKWKVYSLKFREKLNAVFIINQSDLGLNLSELLNGIKILVINPEDLSWNVLSIAVGQMSSIYRKKRVPLLFYPLEYVKAKNVPYEKKYQMWIYDGCFFGIFMEYVERKFRSGYWK